MTGTGTQADPYIVDNFPDFITAVGTSGAYVEFPKNLVKTSDTEIVEGKLYVDGTGEPVTNPVTENLGNYYENVFVLDQNDYAPEGLTSDINIRCTSLNGYGGVIKNIYFKSGHFINTVSGGAGVTKNINFSNALTRTSPSIFNFNVTVSKCIFSATNEYTGSGTLLAAYSSTQGVLKNSSIYARGFSTICSNIATSDSQFNRIYLDGGDVLIPKIHNSLVQGNCQSIETIAGMSYCVFDCEVSGNVTINNATQCIINADKVSGTITGGTSVTSEQMKDAAYLSSIGFPIQT